MISKPTVLILGAGASVDYGFPTGRKLFLDICKAIERKDSLYQFFVKDMNIAQARVEQFAVALKNSGVPSVDFFLENRKDFETLGKLAIATTLIPYEGEAALEPQSTSRWYEILFGRMIEDSRFEDNKLSIVTFNYDRSLEFFLFRSLMNLYELDDKSAEELLGAIKIIHLYGSLGGGLVHIGPYRGYTPNLTERAVQEAAKEIKIVHEAEPSSPEFSLAYELLRAAEEVVFLGFGFHPINIQRLNLQESASHFAKINRRDQRFFACSTGMGNADIVRAKRHLPGGVQFAQDYFIPQFFREFDCLN